MFFFVTGNLPNYHETAIPIYQGFHQRVEHLGVNMKNNCKQDKSQANSDLNISIIAKTREIGQSLCWMGIFTVCWFDPK